MPKQNFSAFALSVTKPVINAIDLSKHLLPIQTIQSKLAQFLIPARTVTKFSHRSGKRKSVRSVTDRFFRLHWGGWIRTRCGRHKKMYKKSANRKHRLRQHVLVNASQSFLLDKMVTSFWRRSKHYIEDIYEPYHTRTFQYARVKPRPYPEKPLKKPLSIFETAKWHDW